MKEIRENIKNHLKGLIDKKMRWRWSTWCWYLSRDKWWRIRGKYQIEENKEDNLESDKSETYERYQREKKEWFKSMDSQKKETMVI